MISEMIYIKREKQGLNRQNNTEFLPESYLSIIQSFSFLIPSYLYYSFHGFIHISIPSYFSLPTTFQLSLAFLPLNIIFVIPFCLEHRRRQDIFVSFRIVSKFNALFVSETPFISTFDLRYVTLKISCIFILTVIISKINNFSVNIEIKIFAILTLTNFAKYYLTYYIVCESLMIYLIF